MSKPSEIIKRDLCSHYQKKLELLPEILPLEEPDLIIDKLFLSEYHMIFGE